MLSHKIITRAQAKEAGSYYADGKDDYYAQEGQSMEWTGSGAAVLGLAAGEGVDKERFVSLLEGKISDKVGIIRKSTRDDSKDRLGIDLTFSAPKSVTMQALVAGDVNIIKAHDLAVDRAIARAEQMAAARLKVHGKTYVEKTGKLVVAKFRHETSRELDPQLHTHAVVLNMTQRQDGQWRALHNDEIIKNVKYLGSVYRAELAMELHRMGYTIRHERDGLFELAHISRSQIEEFSQRSQQIEERLAEKGLTRETATDKEKQVATLETRKEKVEVPREELHQRWTARAKELGIDFENREWHGATPPGGAGNNGGGEEVASIPAELAAERAVRWAINHLTERQSVMLEADLVGTATKHAVGYAKPDQIEAALRKEQEKGYLIREAALYRPTGAVLNSQGLTKEAWIRYLSETGNAMAGAVMSKEDAKRYVETAISKGSLELVDGRFTTQTALEREQRILRVESAGRGQVQSVMPAAVLDEKLASLDQRLKAEGKKGFKEDQKEAIRMILTTSNRVVGVQGYAGVGKSYMLKTGIQLLEENGYRVQTLAPYGGQVKSLRTDGIQAKTLAAFLKAKDQAIDSRTVIALDEAGVVPTRLMEQLLRKVEKAGARIVLLGDVAQTKAIEAGRPFDQLQKSGMKTAVMDEIIRQKDPMLLAAVELAAKGRSAEALEKISNIQEIKDEGKRHQAIVKDYMTRTPEERADALVVSGTNHARREINRLVREEMGTAGKGVELDTLIRRDTTQAERRYSKYYRVGDVIQPDKNYPHTGLERGVLYLVKDTGPNNRLTVLDPDGKEIRFSPATHTKLSVYQPERAELAKGDMIRINRNDAKLDLANGDRFTVAKATMTEVVLEGDGRKVTLDPRNPLHLEHAYATTVHSSQGLTKGEVFADLDSKSSTTRKDLFYTAISRAKNVVRIYTNSKSDLPRAISKENPKLAALDLERRKGREKDRPGHNREKEK